MASGRGCLREYSEQLSQIQTGSFTRWFSARRYGIFAVGVIGASGSVTFVTRLKEDPSAMLHAAASALHFEPADRIEWRIVFHEKPNADLTVSLL